MIKKIKCVIYRLMPRHAFARGVSVLVGGTMVSQLLLVLTAPLLTRLYSPEDFGLLAVYASLLALINVVASLRYELAIPLPENDQEAANVVALCLISLIATSLITALVVVFLGVPIAALLGVPKLTEYFWLLPVGVLISGAYIVFNYWGIRTKRFTTIATAKLKQAVATLAIQLAAFKLGGVALLFGQVAGQGVGTTSLALPAMKTPVFKGVEMNGIKAVAVQYKHFPIFSTWSGIINTLGHQLPSLLFAAFFSATATGLYALAHRILMMPATMLGGALSQVFFAHGSDARRENRLGVLYIKMQDILLQVGMPPALLFIILGPDLFEFIFGANWRESGVFSQWLALAVFMGFVVSPLSQVFAILEKQKTGLFLQSLLFFIRLVGISIGIWLNDMVLAIALFSLAGVLGYLFYLIIGAIYTGCSFMKLSSSLIFSFLSSILLVLPVIIAVYLNIDWVFHVSFVFTGALILLRYWKLYKSEDVI